MKSLQGSLLLKIAVVMLVSSLVYPVKSHGFLSGSVLELNRAAQDPSIDKDAFVREKIRMLQLTTNAIGSGVGVSLGMGTYHIVKSYSQLSSLCKALTWQNRTIICLGVWAAATTFELIELINIGQSELQERQKNLKKRQEEMNLQLKEVNETIKKAKEHGLDDPEKIAYLKRFCDAKVKEWREWEASCKAHKDLEKQKLEKQARNEKLTKQFFKYYPID